tara:strand:- start:1024 stop:1335 length:312 start_codon:yes stop_codon:yes gene_type:complete
MPQIIFNSRIKTLPFGTFVFDFENGYLLTWQSIFDIIYEKYGINKNILRLFDHENKYIDYMNLGKLDKFNINNFAMRYDNAGKTIASYWISFDLFARLGQKLK